jgi:thiol-disulfide isomerase/thioredoxin
MSISSVASSNLSLHGGADKKTLRALVISGSVVFIVAIVLLLVWVLRPKSSDSSSASGSSVSSKPKTGARVAIEVKNDAEANAALSGSDPAVVFVYADWCGFCKRADPIFSELASNPAYSHVKMLKLNSAKAPKFVSERGIRGFPVFLTNFGKNQKIVGYKPKADMEAFLKEARGGGGVRVASGSADVVSDEKMVMDALGGNAPVVVFVSADWCGFCKKLMPIWNEVVGSGKFKNVKLLRIDAKNASNLVKQHGITGFPVLLSNKGERKYIGYRPKEKLEEILMEVQK